MVINLIMLREGQMAEEGAANMVAVPRRGELLQLGGSVFRTREVRHSFAAPGAQHRIYLVLEPFQLEGEVAPRGTLGGWLARLFGRRLLSGGGHYGGSDW